HPKIALRMFIMFEDQEGYLPYRDAWLQNMKLAALAVPDEMKSKEEIEGAVGHLQQVIDFVNQSVKGRLESTQVNLPRLFDREKSMTEMSGFQSLYVMLQ